MNDPNLLALRQKHDEAWAALAKQNYEVIAPRFYREKVGRKLQPVFPWKDIDERVAAEAKAKLLWDVWLKLFQMYVELSGGERLPLPTLYEKKETPLGDIRWKKIE